MFLFLIVMAVLIYFKMTNRISLSWWLIAGIGVVTLWFTGALNSLIPSLTTGSNTTDPLKKDACGCGPGQSVSMSRRNFWGNYKSAGIVPCQIALTRIAKDGKWRSNGCVN
jgi:hypothetical protein